MHPYVWHNTFIHVCDMAHSYICDITHSYMRTLTHPYTCMCDVFIYVWHNLTHPCICMCDVFIYVWRTHPHVCDVWHDTIICVRHDTLLRVMWCRDTRDITHAFVWRDAFISVKCRICMLKLIERNPRPRGGFLFTIFPHQEPCVRGTPPKDLYQVLRGGTSYTRFLMRGHSNRKLPRGGGFLSIKVWHGTFVCLNAVVIQWYRVAKMQRIPMHCCKSLSAKEPLIIGLLSGKRLIKIRHECSHDA